MPLAAQKLSKAARVKTDVNASGINFLYVSTSSARYLYRIISHADGPWFLKYLKWQIRFFKTITPEIRHKVLVRTYMRDYGWHQRDYIKEHFNGMRFDDRGLSLSNAIKFADLIIVDNRKTSYLEALASGKPVLLFWDPSLWQMRPDAVGSFNLLYQSGILHESPEGAAQQLIKVADDPKKWWNSSPVRQARERFMSLFAIHKNWLGDWVTAFNEELG
jgi:putative transferase (TIGR04331 family)